MTEGEMVRWHHRFNGHGLVGLRELMMDREAWPAEFHGGHKELDMTKHTHGELRSRVPLD